MTSAEKIKVEKKKTSQLVNKTNLKRIKTCNRKRTAESAPEPVLETSTEPNIEAAPKPVPEQVPEPALEPKQQPVPDAGPAEETKKRKCYISHALRRLVWNTYIQQHIGEHKCLCCELTMMTQLDFECGHVVSVYNGGTLQLDNLRPICSACNRSMNYRNMVEFMREQNMPGLKLFL